MNETPPIMVPQSAFQSIATAVLRQGITALGASLVARGLLSQGQADTLAPEALGVAMVFGSAAWAWWKANHTHIQLVTGAKDQTGDALQLSPK